MIKLSTQEQEYISLLAANAAKEVMKEGIKVHIDTCPVRLTAVKICFIFVGIALATGTGVGVMQAVMKFIIP